MINLSCEYKKHSFYFPFLLIVLSVLSVYIPSFSGEFIHDDISLVKKNEYLREWHSIGSYLSQEDGYDIYSGGHTGYYRPLINLSYTLDYTIWGIYAPGFRLTNLILHILTCFVLLYFFNLFLHNKNISLLLTLIFAIHPVNTETVSWITSRNNILVTLFGILSLLFYIRSYTNGKYYEYLLSIIFFSFALFSKEFGLMLLPVFFLYQRLFKNRKGSVFIELREYLPFILIALIYFVLRQNVTGVVITPQGSSDYFSKIYHVPYVFFLNLKMIFLPVNLHCFITRYPDVFFNTRTIFSITGLILLFILMCIYRKKHLFIFSVVAFFIAIFPVLGIVKTSATSIIAMRWLYFPLPFILLLLALPLEKLYEYNPRLILVLFIPVIFYLGFNSYTLNRFLWHSEKDFYRQEVLQFKNYFYSDGLAAIYKNEKKMEQALILFEKSMEMGVKRDINYFDYAELLIEKGNLEKALEYLGKAMDICSSHDMLGSILHKKGVIYIELNNLQEAEKNIRKAINLSPEEPVYWENLGVVQGKTGNHEEALYSFKKALRLGTDSKSIFKNIANAYISINECHEAIRLINRIYLGEKDIESKRLLRRAEACLAGENI